MSAALKWSRLYLTAGTLIIYILYIIHLLFKSLVCLCLFSCYRWLKIKWNNNNKIKKLLKCLNDELVTRLTGTLRKTINKTVKYVETLFKNIVNIVNLIFKNEAHIYKVILLKTDKLMYRRMCMRSTLNWDDINVNVKQEVFYKHYQKHNQIPHWASVFTFEFYKLKTPQILCKLTNTLKNNNVVFVSISYFIYYIYYTSLRNTSHLFEFLILNITKYSLLLFLSHKQ